MNLVNTLGFPSPSCQGCQTFSQLKQRNTEVFGSWFCWHQSLIVEVFRCKRIPKISVNTPEFLATHPSLRTSKLTSNASAFDPGRLRSRSAIHGVFDWWYWVRLKVAKGWKRYKRNLLTADDFWWSANRPGWCSLYGACWSSCRALRPHVQAVSDGRWRQGCLHTRGTATDHAKLTKAWLIYSANLKNLSQTVSGSFGFEYSACRAERTLFKMCGTASSGQNKKKNLRCPHKGAKEAILPEHLIQLNCVRRWMMTKHIKRDNLLVQGSFAAGVLLIMAKVGGLGEYGISGVVEASDSSTKKQLRCSIGSLSMLLWHQPVAWSNEPFRPSHANNLANMDMEHFPLFINSIAHFFQVNPEVVEISTYTNPFTQKSAHQNSHLVHASLASPADGIGPGLTAGMDLLGSHKPRCYERILFGRCCEHCELIMFWHNKLWMIDDKRV